MARTSQHEARATRGHPRYREPSTNFQTDGEGGNLPLGVRKNYRQHQTQPHTIPPRCARKKMSPDGDYEDSESEDEDESVRAAKEREPEVKRRPGRPPKRKAAIDEGGHGRPGPEPKKAKLTLQSATGQGRQAMPPPTQASQPRQSQTEIPQALNQMPPPQRRENARPQNAQTRNQPTQGTQSQRQTVGNNTTSSPYVYIVFKTEDLKFSFLTMPEDLVRRIPDYAAKVDVARAGTRADGTNCNWLRFTDTTTTRDSRLMRLVFDYLGRGTLPVISADDFSGSLRSLLALGMLAEGLGLVAMGEAVRQRTTRDEELSDYGTFAAAADELLRSAGGDTVGKDVVDSWVGEYLTAHCDEMVELGLRSLYRRKGQEWGKKAVTYWQEMNFGQGE